MLRKLVVISAIASSAASAAPIHELWSCRAVSGGPIVLSASVSKEDDVTMALVVAAGDIKEAIYYVEGINRRWDYGPLLDKKLPRFSFVIEPDGTGLYVDFINGYPAKSSQQFQCELDTFR